VKVGSRRPQQLAPDPDLIRKLAGLLTETGLSEIEYSIGEHRIRVAREIVAAAPAPAAAPSPAAANGALKNGADHAPTISAAPAAGTVTSPIVGVAYLAPQPDVAPFVRIGDQISEGQTLLIIEAMKVMNQIRAPRGGRVTRIFVEDAEPVEYGAPLMLIE
jgi:acetyl-CoA carboxylase biotin carboxyl carrier protein